MNVADVMSKSVLTIKGDLFVNEAAASMLRNDLGMLVVMDDNAKMIGVITERDILEKVTVKGITANSTTVQHVMTKDVVTILPDKTLSEAALVMKKSKCKRLPVLHDDELVGVISSTDILNSMTRLKKDLLDVALQF